MKTLVSFCLFILSPLSIIYSQGLCSDFKNLNESTSIVFTSYGTANNIISINEYQVSSNFATKISTVRLKMGIG